MLPPGIELLERGWLSSNNILCIGRGNAAVVDTGYASHAAQTTALLRSRLGVRPLDLIINTHLHSDHCGGNSALQQAWPEACTLIPPGEAEAVRQWACDGLSHAATGQSLQRFRVDGVLPAGTTLRLGDFDWEIHAAPGHDPHAVVLFERDQRLLISADALWESGFGIVFPELVGQAAFDQVEETLGRIEALQARQVIPGHGPMFSDVAGALSRARERLQGYRADPRRHARHAARVLLRFKLMELGTWLRSDFEVWFDHAPLLRDLHAHHFASQSWAPWREALLEDLRGAGAIAFTDTQIVNRP